MNSPQKKLRSARTVRAGFSFVEVLFAVMILGIGFIMIAAIFPVAIKQTQLNVEENGGSRTLFNAKAQIRSLADNASTRTVSPIVWRPTVVTPTLQTTRRITGTVSALNEADPALPTQPWGANFAGVEFRPYIQGNQIETADPRFAWALAYQVDAVWDPTANSGTGGYVPSKSVNFFVFVLASRARATFDVATDSLRYSSGTTMDANQNQDVPANAMPANLEPKESTVVFYPPNVSGFGATGGIRINASGNNYQALGEGAYFVVSDDGAATGKYTGMIFKLGGTVDIANRAYDLEPGYDVVNAVAGGGAMPPPAGTTQIIKILHIGRSKVDPKNSASTFDGPIQDVKLEKFTYTRP